MQKGARISQAALNCRINSKNINELASMEIADIISEIRYIDNDTLLLSKILIVYFIIIF